MRHVRQSIFVALVTWMMAFSAMGQTTAAPISIPLGVYLVELGDFDTQKKSFTADFWLWGLSPPEYQNWIHTLDYPNSINVVPSQATEQVINNTLWSSIHVSGSFREEWNLQNHPFDKRELLILIEESYLETSKIAFQADAANSNAAEALVPQGWHISNFTISPVSKKYSTAFGDPSKAPNSSSQYSRLEIKIEIKRDSYAVFWKLTAIPYIAAILTFASFFVVFDNILLVSRFSLLIGSLFAACLSLRGLNSELGSADIFTLMDSIHLATLIYVFLGILFAIITRELFKREVPERKILFWNIIIGTASLGVYIAFNFALVWSAINS